MNIIKYPQNNAQELINNMQKITSSRSDAQNNCAFGIVIVNRDGSIEHHYESVGIRYISSLIGGIEMLKRDILNNACTYEEVELDE
jgi:hypothetical protein